MSPKAYTEQEEQLARFAKAADRTLPVTAPLAAGMLALSFYSFVWVGLAHIPK